MRFAPTQALIDWFTNSKKVDKILNNFWFLLLYRVVLPILMIVAFATGWEPLMVVLIVFLAPLLLIIGIGLLVAIVHNMLSF